MFQVRYPRHSPCATLSVHVVAQAAPIVRLGLQRGTVLGGRLSGQLLLAAAVQPLQLLPPRTTALHRGTQYARINLVSRWIDGDPWSRFFLFPPLRLMVRLFILFNRCSLRFHMSLFYTG